MNIRNNVSLGLRVLSRHKLVVIVLWALGGLMGTYSFIGLPRNVKLLLFSPYSFGEPWMQSLFWFWGGLMIISMLLLRLGWLVSRKFFIDEMEMRFSSPGKTLIFLVCNISMLSVYWMLGMAILGLLGGLLAYF
jgi:hypothetical protein